MISPGGMSSVAAPPLSCQWPFDDCVQVPPHSSRPFSVNQRSSVVGWKATPSELRMPCATTLSFGRAAVVSSSQMLPSSGCVAVSLQSRTSPFPGTLHGEPIVT